MTKDYDDRIAASVEYIMGKIRSSPKIAVILGSGLGNFGEMLADKTSIDTQDIPHYPVSSVEGHAGRLLFGKIKSDNQSSSDLMVFQGRIHFYESNDATTVAYPIEVAHRIGIEKIIITNAAGGVNEQFMPGDLMFIKDYMNLSFENPLVGSVSDKARTCRPEFNGELLSKAKSIALENRIPFKEGVYCWTKGPSYESSAEIRMMRAWGADAVGMSTVPEVIVAASYGIAVLGISCITNFATGLTSEKLAHAEVTEVANKVKHNFTQLVSKIVLQL
jgi:purine-nucleoside phosphorylase